MDKAINKFRNTFTCEKAKRIYSYIPFTLSLVFALLSFAVVIYYTVFPGGGYLHSDCTDTMLWAQASVDAGKVFNEDFCYAALLPFGASLWLVPMIKIFGYTMAVHVAGMVIFACLFFLSVIFMCRSLGWNWSFTLISSGFLMLIMSSSEKLREIMWGHVIYYSLSLILLFTGLGILLRMYANFEKGNKKKAYIYAALLFVFVLLAATNGLQIIALYALPLIAAVVLEAVFNSKDALISSRNLYYGFGAIIMTVGVIFGYILLTLLKGDISAGYADAYSALDDVSNWMGNFLKFPGSYFSLMGVLISDGASLGSFDIITNVIKTVVSVIILILPITLLFIYKKIEDKNTRILLWVHITVSAVIMAGFICGRLSAANWRLTPIIGTSVITSVAAIKTMFSIKEEHLVWRRVATVLLIMPFLLSFINIKTIKDMPADYGRDNELHVLSDFLVENDLEYGYATFWYSQATTLISDSKVKVRCINADSQGGITPYYYQTNKNWYNDQEGIDKYFIALTSGEARSISYNADWLRFTDEHLTNTLECGNFKIYVFDANIFGISAENTYE